MSQREMPPAEPVEPVRPILIIQPTMHTERIIENTYREYTEGYQSARDEQEHDTEPIIIPPMPAPVVNVHVVAPPMMQQRSPEVEQAPIRDGYYRTPPTRAAYPEIAPGVRTSADTSMPKPDDRPAREGRPYHDEPLATSVAEPIVRKDTPSIPIVVQPEKFNEKPTEKINDVPRKDKKNDKEKINEPLNFSPPEPAQQAGPRKKFQHTKRDRGRQRKYHQTIALLEDYADGDLDQFNRLDEQMQRYYKREYAEYFGRDAKAKAEQRLANRTKAARTRRESEKRRIAEISRGIQTSSAV